MVVTHLFLIYFYNNLLYTSKIAKFNTVKAHYFAELFMF